MSSPTNKNTTNTSFATNDNDTMIKRSGSFSSAGGSHGNHFHSSGGATSVPECILHTEKGAVALEEGSDENQAISSSLASSVAKKAFALSVTVADAAGIPAERLGQGGLIQCPSMPTEDGSPPGPKKRKLSDAYGKPRSAIKHSSSTERVSAIPVTARHNVLQDYCRQEHYTVISIPLMSNPPFGGDDGLIRAQKFESHNTDYSSGDAMEINFPNTSEGRFSWKYGCDITSGDVIRKKFLPQTDRNISFEAVGSSFEYKIGQKIGMAVYRNYEFDFTSHDIYANHDWDKNKLSQDDILRLFGKDYSVSIYTGEITGISTDGEVFRHDINTFRGCSGAIVFLLDKNQDGLVEDQYFGKAIGVHAGAHKTKTTTDNTRARSESSKANFNIAFALAGFADKEKYKPPPSETDEK
ncbi:expressed unknown protein [Seminavis robusta]|uniref:Uncharacterized protein n=1 Tax=Seminavis robusta TaxID=568900 RepID=A0A9N8HJM3_9STRA|nr:expressed unknown protein [Seminavis robusta]|eukprot:Sro560_g166660.1 n/a (411) ;mRNA; f:19135-20367